MPARAIFDPVALESSARLKPRSHRAPRSAHLPPPKVHFPPPEREAEEIVPKDTRPRHLEVKVKVDHDGLSTPGRAPAVGDARIVGLLPTPPMNSAESMTPTAPSAWEDQMNGRGGHHEHQMRSTSNIGTPLHPHRPLTPDITPPGDLPKLSALQLPADQRAPPSSRTDSFKTAHEDPYSSDGEGREQPPMPMTHANNGLEDRSSTPLARSAKVDVTSAALMAAIEQDLHYDHEQTPTQETPGREFRAFDGAWDAAGRPSSERNGHESKREEVVPTAQTKFEQPSKEYSREEQVRHGEQKYQGDDAETRDDVQPPSSMQKVTKRRRARKRGNKASSATTSEDERPAARPATPPLRRNTNKGLSLRERIEQNREAERRSSTREFAEKINWPLSGEGIPTDGTEGVQHTSNGRPISMASNASSVIEALVLSGPPPTLRRLRHAGKNIAWTKPMQGVRIVTSSVPPTHPPHLRLVHQPAIDDMKRASLASERSISPARPERRATDPTPETIPAVVIPERSSNAGARRKLPVPILKHEKSQENIKEARLRDQRRSGRRVRVEESPSTSKDTVETDHTPRVNPRMDETFRGPAGKRTMWMDDSPVNGASPLKDGHLGMTSYLAAGLVSGSQQSHTSTPEALEVNEATAVSIYPHNNHSLLVVQQQSRPVSQDPRLALPGTNTTINHGSRDLSEESVVRIPPIFKVIPPTPSVMSPVDEPNRQLGNRKSSTERTRPAGVAMSLVKRALGNKRYGDGFVSPFARFNQHSNSQQRGIDHEATPTSSNSGYHIIPRRHQPLLTTRKDTLSNTTTTAPATATTSTNLSPFWRPRGFWDEFDDPSNTVEKEITAKMQDEFLERGRLEEFDPRNVHCRQQRPRRSSASSSPSTSRGDGGHHGYDGAAPISRGSENSNSTSRPSTGRTTNDAEGSEGGPRRRRRRVYLIKPLGVQVEFVGRKGVQERQRELEKGMIKRRISSPTMMEYPAVI